MKCDKCENEATVHEVTRKHGVTIEKHLCETCAAQSGVGVQPGSGLGETAEITVSSTPLIAVPVPIAATGQAAPVVACPTCGLAFAEFKTSGNLGCPQCYRAFEVQISPLIERAHEGGTHHVGKVPKRLLGAQSSSLNPAALRETEEREQRRVLLRKQLEEAVRAEQYERAATIRDEIRRLSERAV